MNMIESDYHLTLVYPFYHDTTTKYLKRPTLKKVESLMSSDAESWQRNLSKSICFAMKKRNLYTTLNFNLHDL